jgi:alkylation response protein AidB-like acyl-CoA dehydrogenase
LLEYRGLSYFILDMKQPGVTVQPLRQMNRYASFNQVFLTDAKVEPEFLVSEVGNGWAVTTTTLMHERRRRATQLGDPLGQAGSCL